MLGVSDYGAFVLAFILLLLLPGPGNLALVLSTSQGGLRGGLASVFGLLLGDQVLMWLTVVGVAALLQSQPALFLGLQCLGAVYLAWMGWRMLGSSAGTAAPVQVRPGRYFLDTMMITLLNPKAVMFYFAFFPQFIDPQTHLGWVTFGFMAATVAVLGFVYCSGVVWLTYTMAQRLQANPKVTRALGRLAGLCLMGFGLRLLWLAG
ncbi:MAG: LysE family transporter [Alphaproteobacteria bacterium]|nr:LysE family transporter [Alphaproteobacteria bacterium]